MLFQYLVENKFLVEGRAEQLPPEINLIEGNNAVIKLDVSGPCEVTSNSFEVPGNVELPDAEHHVASIVDKVSLSLTATVKTGRGYEPADSRGEEETAVGALKVDASFSPVRRVAYSVENASSKACTLE